MQSSKTGRGTLKPAVSAPEAMWELKFLSKYCRKLLKCRNPCKAVLTLVPRMLWLGQQPSPEKRIRLPESRKAQWPAV